MNEAAILWYFLNRDGLSATASVASPVAAPSNLCPYGTDQNSFAGFFIAVQNAARVWPDRLVSLAALCQFK